MILPSPPSICSIIFPLISLFPEKGKLENEFQFPGINQTLNTFVTCFASSSTTSSNKSFGVEPEVFDAIAKYAGRSLICSHQIQLDTKSWGQELNDVFCWLVEDSMFNAAIWNNEETNFHGVVTPVGFGSKHARTSVLLQQFPELVPVFALDLSQLFLLEGKKVISRLY